MAQSLAQHADSDYREESPARPNGRRGFDLLHAPETIRTSDLLLRRQALYPAELRARDPNVPAWNRPVLHPPVPDGVIRGR